MYSIGRRRTTRSESLQSGTNSSTADMMQRRSAGQGRCDRAFSMCQVLESATEIAT